jgi:hypothetical protein
MTTVLDFARVGEPRVTLHADPTHFILQSDESAKRSLAIIPTVTDQVIQRLFTDSNGEFSNPNQVQLARRLDENLKTNLFVFFPSGVRMMFELRFVEKSKADYVLAIQYKAKGGCPR